MKIIHVLNIHIDLFSGNRYYIKIFVCKFFDKTSVGDAEYQQAYRFCICKGIFNASKLATLSIIPLYKKLKRK